MVRTEYFSVLMEKTIEQKDLKDSEEEEENLMFSEKEGNGPQRQEKEVYKDARGS